MTIKTYVGEEGQLFGALNEQIPILITNLKARDGTVWMDEEVVAKIIIVKLKTCHINTKGHKAIEDIPEF